MAGVNHDSETENPLYARLWATQAHANRLETWLCLAVTVAAVCFVLAVIFYFGQPVCVPLRGRE